MPTVLIASPYLPPHIGGVERYVETVAVELGKRDFRVIIATTGRRGNVSHRVLGNQRVPIYELDTLVRVSNSPFGLHWHRDLAEIVEGERVDIINGHGPVPGLAETAAFAKGSRPFVLTYHAGPLRKRSSLLNVALQSYERTVLASTLSRSTSVVCSSEYVVRHLTSLAGPGPMEVISPGVNTDIFRPVGRREPKSLLFVGTLEPSTAYKRLDLAIETSAELVRQGLPVTLEVVGDGQARPHYEQFAKRLGIESKVTFVGAKEGIDLVESYGRANCLLMPTEFDSLPTVILESFACETPVVATPVGQINDLVTDGTTGSVVPVGDLEATVAAAKAILTDPALRADLGTKARLLVEDQYSARRLGDATARVFEHVLGPRSRPSVRAPAKRPIVALVTPYFPPRTGGVEVYVAELARRLEDRGDFQPIVVTTGADGHREHSSDPGPVRIIRLGITLTASNSPIGVAWPLQLRKLFKEERIDLINVHSPVPGLADAAVISAGQRPVVFTYHSGSMVKGHKRVDAMLRRYERHVLPFLWARSSAVVGVSPMTMASEWPGASVISPGVDIDRFTPGPRANLSPTLLYVGRMERSSRWKGVDVLIQAFAEVKRQLPDARLELVGDGDLVEEYRGLVHRLGVDLSTEFRGTLNGEALVQAYRDASVVVLPSTSDAESFGICLVEAMAAGVPVIGSRIGGIPYVISEGVSGLLVEPDDVSALANACVRLLSDPDALRRLSNNARSQAVFRHPWDVTVSQYSALFSRVLGGDNLTHRVTPIGTDQEVPGAGKNLFPIARG